MRSAMQVCQAVFVKEAAHTERKLVTLQLLLFWLKFAVSLTTPTVDAHATTLSVLA